MASSLSRRGMRSAVVAGLPLDLSVKHSFTPWAKVVGGILRVGGFSDFLSNTNIRRHDPPRQPIDLLGAARPDEWLAPAEWAKLAT